MLDEIIGAQKPEPNVIVIRSDISVTSAFHKLRVLLFCRPPSKPDCVVSIWILDDTLIKS